MGAASVDQLAHQSGKMWGAVRLIILVGLERRPTCFVDSARHRTLNNLGTLAREADHDSHTELLDTTPLRAHGQDEVAITCSFHLS